MVPNPQDLKHRIDESGVPYRELDARATPRVHYQKISDWKRGFVELTDPELQALETALNEAIRSRADKFNKMLSQGAMTTA
jgi:hypothetical protein